MANPEFREGQQPAALQSKVEYGCLSRISFRDIVSQALPGEIPMPGLFGTSGQAALGVNQMKRVTLVMWSVSLLLVIVIGGGTIGTFALLTPGTPLAAAELVVVAGAVVVLVFAIDIGVLWALSQMGGPLKADVKATLTKFGGSLLITSAGLLGSFIAIACVGFTAIYLFAKLLIGSR